MNFTRRFTIVASLLAVSTSSVRGGFDLRPAHPRGDERNRRDRRHSDDSNGYRNLLFGRGPDYSDGTADGPETQPVGTLEKEKVADLIAMPADPMADITRPSRFPS